MSNSAQNAYGIQLSILRALCALFVFYCALMLAGCSCSNEWGTKDPDEAAEEIVDELFEEAGVPKPDEYEFKGEILEERDASQSVDVYSEEALSDELLRRGFENATIESNYDMSGGYDMDSELIDPTAKHPMYYCFYVAQNDSTWMLVAIDGEIMATPLDGIAEETVQTVLCENDYVTVYDGYSNVFIRGVPDETEMRIVKVNRVDAATLENYTPGA